MSSFPNVLDSRLTDGDDVGLTRRPFLTLQEYFCHSFDSAVVKALCYQMEGLGFKTQGDEWLLSIYLILPAALGPGVYSTSNRNEYQKQKSSGPRVKLTTLPPSVSRLSKQCEMLRPLISLWASMAWYWDSFTFLLLLYQLIADLSKPHANERRLKKWWPEDLIN
jgi:hypothetical protein